MDTKIIHRSPTAKRALAQAVIDSSKSHPEPSPSSITPAQHEHLLRQGEKAFSKFSHAADLLNMARNMGFPVESLEHLTRAQATKMLNRLDELNDPKRKVPR